MVSLRSIFMEDLLQPESSKQRAMVISSSGESIPKGAWCVSKSCPDMADIYKMSGSIHGSLPDHLEVCSKMDIPQTNCPCTPPPSPSLKAHKNLVIISTLLVDSNAPNFKSDYDSIRRSTSIDFNCLDLVISVESWVVVLDFFSASPVEHNDKIEVQVPHGNNEVLDMESIAETNISVRSLTMVLVRPDRDVARANISNIEILVKTCGLSKEVEGKLGSMSLSDLTLHGQLYRERFLTSGKQALHFDYVRHAPNTNLDYNCELKLRMSSVTYVHTKRFVAEIQAFFNHFTQLQAVMSSIRAATSGQKV